MDSGCKHKVKDITFDGIDRGCLVLVCGACGAELGRIPDTSPWTADEMVHDGQDDEQT